MREEHDVAGYRQTRDLPASNLPLRSCTVTDPFRLAQTMPPFGPVRCPPPPPPAAAAARHRSIRRRSIEPKGKRGRERNTVEQRVRGNNSTGSINSSGNDSRIGSTLAEARK